jgi:hypothetical protein
VLVNRVVVTDSSTRVQDEATGGQAFRMRACEGKVPGVSTGPASNLSLKVINRKKVCCWDTHLVAQRAIELQEQIHSFIPFPCAAVNFRERVGVDYENVLLRLILCFSVSLSHKLGKWLPDLEDDAFFGGMVFDFSLGRSSGEPGTFNSSSPSESASY